jgi:hypothetical protein
MGSPVPARGGKRYPSGRFYKGLKVLQKRKCMGGGKDMMKFLLGVIVGILICFLFFYFGGGKTVKKFGEGLTDTGKRMEILEETILKGKEEGEKGVKKKIFKEEKEIQKRSQ